MQRPTRHAGRRAGSHPRTPPSRNRPPTPPHPSQALPQPPTHPEPDAAAVAAATAARRKARDGAKRVAVAANALARAADGAVEAYPKSAVVLQVLGGCRG